MENGDVIRVLSWNGMQEFHVPPSLRRLRESKGREYDCLPDIGEELSIDAIGYCIIVYPNV